MRFGSYDEYVSYFARLVELEREEEMRFHREEIKRLSGEKREKLGRAILNLNGKDLGRGIEGYLVKFGRRELPETEIGVGDLVLVSRGKPRKDDPQGTVVEKGRSFLVVAFQNRPPRWVYGRGIRVDLYANDVTFQRMLAALKALRGNERLINLLLGKIRPHFGSAGRIEFSNPSLNPSQKEAVKRSLEARDTFLIHGPPGTGKTTTLVEAIVQHVRRGHRVLATADSNIAVDNLMEKLLEAGVKAVRVGNPARVTKALRENTLDHLVTLEGEFREAEKLWKEVEKLREAQSAYQKPTPQWRRGMSDGDIKRAAKEGRSVRGVPQRVIVSMAKWLEVQEEISKLVERARALEMRAVERVLERAEVVCTTNSTAGSELLQGKNFDVVFIDEATQSVEPSCLIPMVKGRKWVMAGDHRQLPPTILSEKARPLEFTLFERLLGVYGDEIKSLLRVQYRMNERIMAFPNREFYDGLLIADGSVAKITLEDLGVSLPSSEGWLMRALAPSKPIAFVDTLGECPERQRQGSTSRENPCEARVVKDIVEGLLKMGVREEWIGVISPYDDQVDLLASILPEDVEVKTVDGYQGREKEVVVISFVRSNDRGELGFLEDLRRLNVAITRAKRKLVMVGDSRTLSTNPTYARLVEYVRGEGGYVGVRA